MDAHLKMLLSSSFVCSVLLYLAPGLALPQFEIQHFSFSSLQTICCKRQTPPCLIDADAQCVGFYDF